MFHHYCRNGRSCRLVIMGGCERGQEAQPAGRGDSGHFYDSTENSRISYITIKYLILLNLNLAKSNIILDDSYVMYDTSNPYKCQVQQTKSQKSPHM